MKIPLFSIIPLIESYYIEQISSEKVNFKESKSIKKSEKTLSKSIKDPVKWIFVEFEGKKSLVLMKKSLDDHVFLTGPLRLKKAKTEKDLEYWKKKLLDVLRLQKSLSDILYLEGIPEEAEELLLKARGYPVGTVREWQGQKFKKLSSGKWMRLYEGSGSRGEKQASRNVIKKIQNASSMEEMLEIVRQNKERFIDPSGKPLPVISAFLKVARENEDKTQPDKKNQPDKPKYDEKTLDLFDSWISGADLTNMRNAIRISDGTINTEEDLTLGELKGARKYENYSDIIEKNMESIQDKVLYRGTQDQSWLEVKPGDEIPTGIVSFSKADRVAKQFTGGQRIIIRYSKPPIANGIDYHKLMVEDAFGDNTKKLFGSRINEEEVALRTKMLKVKKITKPSKKGEYTIIDVEVSPTGLSKSMEKESKLMEKLSNDFNNPLAKRENQEKDKLENSGEKKELEYWKDKITNLLETDSVEKSLHEILYPGIMLKSLSDEVEDLLIKARGFAVGTIRNWRGKEHKKMANGKWVRTYKELESRGAKQAIQNVRRKIISASTMEELLEIVKQNASRFQDDKGKMLPIVKEFIQAARGTEIGEKQIKDPAKEFYDNLKIGDEIEIGVFYSDLPAGTVGKITKKYIPKDAKDESDMWVKIDLGENLSGQKLKVSVPVNVLKGYPAPEKEIINKDIPAATIIQTVEDAEELIDKLNNKNIEGFDFYYTGEDGDISFMVEVAKEDVLENIPIHPEDILSKDESEIREMFGRGKDKQKRKARTQSLDSILEKFGGREKFRQALLMGRKTEVEGKDSQIDLGTGEVINRQTDELIGFLVERTGLTEEEILRELGIGTKEEKKRIESTQKKRGERKSVETDVEEYDETLDPTSELYKFRDTGYIAGSRKEKAGEHIRIAKKDGRTVKTREIDWVDLEKNPREANQLITKSNLFGTVDWEMLKKEGMEPATGYLIDRVYASIAKEPVDDPVSRRNYSYGIETIRERLEKSKTPDDITKALNEIRDEFEGTMMSARETDEYHELTEEIKVIAADINAKKEEGDRLYGLYNKTSAIGNLKWEQEKRVNRGWKPKPELDEKIEKLQVERDKTWKEYMDYKEKYPEAFIPTRGESEIFDKLQELYKKRRSVVEATKIRNLEENPYTRAWMSLGDRFIGVINYRNYKGSKSFGNHVAKAKYGQIKTWDWAEKKGGTIKKANKAAVKFQLKVAEKYTRVGGRNIKTRSTQELKDKFNLREVQSGNWVLKDPTSAKFHVEKSGEAFADLADITGIPDDKISFNGRLAMAFGARGKGSVNFGGAAVAHYEPVHRVINLTKMGGGGSLAHEWFHSMDNLLSEAYGLPETSQKYLSEAPGIIQDEPLKEAFDNLVGVMTKGSAVSYKPFMYTEEDYKNGVYNFKNVSSGSDTFKGRIVSAGNVEDVVNVVDNYFDSDIEKYEMGRDVAIKAKDTYREKSYTKRVRKLKKNKKGWLKIAVAYHHGDESGGVVNIPDEKGISNFKKNANDLDMGHTKTYWSSNIELAARAFAAYVDDKLSEKDRKNDYLSSYADNKYYKDPLWGDTFPYPEGEERKRINESMDNLFKIIKDNNMIQKAIDVDFQLEE